MKSTEFTKHVDRQINRLCVLCIIIIIIIIIYIIIITLFNEGDTLQQKKTDNLVASYM